MDTERAEPARCDLLLTGGTVITMDDERRVFESGAVAVTGERIVAVGDASELVAAFRSQRTVDCRGAAVIPGFVSAHDHLFQNAGRGLGEGLDFREWLSDFMFPLALNVTKQEAVAFVTMTVVEEARGGTTAVLDHHYAGTDLETTLAVADAVERVGLRGAIGRGMGREQPQPADEQFELMVACIEAHPKGSKVELWPAPGDVIYNDQEFVIRAAELARSYGVGWHTHCSQYKTDAEVYVAEHGVRPVSWMYDAGILGPDCHIAHMIFLDDAEVQRAGETHTGIAYCPVSHGIFGLGTMRLRELRDAGAVIGLGYDGAVAGFRSDMFEQMKMAVMIQRLAAQDPTISGPEEALELATREGARFLGVDAGVLAVGKLADIAVVGLEGAHFTPRHDPVIAVAYTARSNDVRVTISGGEVIFEDGRCTRIDEDEVMAEAQARVDGLLDRLNLPIRRWQPRDRTEPGASRA